MLLVVFLFFIGGNKMVLANTPAHAKVPFAPHSHHKHHHPAAGFVKTIDNFLTEVVYSSDVEEDEPSPVNLSQSAIVFSPVVMFAAFLQTILSTSEKPGRILLSPFAVTVKKFLLIRILRI